MNPLRATRSFVMAMIAVAMQSGCSSLDDPASSDTKRFEGFSDETSVGGNTLIVDVTKGEISRVIYYIEGAERAVEHTFSVTGERMTGCMEKQFSVRKVPVDDGARFETKRELERTEELARDDLLASPPGEHVTRLQSELSRMISFFRQHPENFKTIDTTFLPR